MTSTWSIGAASPSKNAFNAAASVASKAAVRPRADVARRLFEALGIAAGEDDVGALAAGEAGGLQADSGAAADQDDGLAEQLRLARRS